MKRFIFIVCVLAQIAYSQLSNNGTIGYGLAKISNLPRGVVVYGNSITLGYTWQTPDTNTAFAKVIANYMNVYLKNGGVAGITASQIKTNLDADTLKSGYAFLLEGGVNDVNTNIARDTTIKYLEAMVDTTLARGNKVFYIGIISWTNGTTARHYKIDTINTTLQSYVALRGGYYLTDSINALIGMLRAGTTNPNNLYDLQPAYSADGVHLSIIGMRRVALGLCRTFRAFYTIPNDTATSQLQLVIASNDTLSWYAYDYFQRDSTTISYKWGINGTRNEIAGINISGNLFTNVLTDYANYLDTCYWTISTSGTQSKTLSNSFVNYQPIVKSDSLVIAYEWQSNKGWGKSSYAQLIPSLYGWSNDTLMLGTTGGVESTDPVDSTAYGFLSFNKTNSQRASMTHAMTIQPNFTVIIKVRGWGNSAGCYMGAVGQAGWSIYTSTNLTFYDAVFTNGTGYDYYALWGQQADDSVTTITSAGNIYRNGVLRVTSPTTLTGAQSLQFILGMYTSGALLLNGRYYYIYFFNRVLSQSEIQKFK